MPTINGDLFRLRREERGWLLNDMATRACMSVKQIRQIEEGGDSAFYSNAVKLTAAKKVGALLGLKPEDIFAAEREQTTPGYTPAQAYTDTLVIDVQSIKEQDELASAISHPLDSQEIEKTEPSSLASKSKTLLCLILCFSVLLIWFFYDLKTRHEPVEESAPPTQALPADVASAPVLDSSAASTASSSSIAP